MQMTTIKVSAQTKKELDTMRSHDRESYDRVVRKMLYIARNAKRHPQLSRKAVEAIEIARAQIKQGDYYTLEQVRKRLNL